MKTPALVTVLATFLMTALVHASDNLTPKCKTPTHEGDVACWLKVTNTIMTIFREDCYVWTIPLTDQTVTWSGQCRAGLADGHGKMIRKYSGESESSIGSYADGKQQGQWEVQSVDGGVWIGPFVDGKRQGQWKEWYESGAIRVGSYVDDMRQGRWEIRTAEGMVLIGPYVNGERHGQWKVLTVDRRVRICNVARGKIKECHNQ